MVIGHAALIAGAVLIHLELRSPLEKLLPDLTLLVLCLFVA